MAKNKKAEKDTIMCTCCGKDKLPSDFYVSSSPFHKHTGKLHLCKECLWDFIGDDVEKLKFALRMVDKPFLSDLLISSQDESEKSNKNAIKLYMKNVNMKNYIFFTWDDSDFKGFKSSYTMTTESTVDENKTNIDVDNLKVKYGHGYPDEEYLLFENKYKTLKPSFKIATTMHDECLKEYCVNKVKETLAKARGEFKEAKEWATMAKDVANAGKLQPNQMSKADLSNGLDSFSQLSRMVEEHQDIIPILPKFIMQPKDAPDVDLWLYVNYVRDILGMEEASYYDVYKFYRDRVEEYGYKMVDGTMMPKDMKLPDGDI